MDVGAVDCILWLLVQFLSDKFTYVQKHQVIKYVTVPVMIPVSSLIQGIRMFFYRFDYLIEGSLLNLVGFVSGGDSIIVNTGFFCNYLCYACIVFECSWSFCSGSLFNWGDYLECYINGDESEVAVDSIS